MIFTRSALIACLLFGCYFFPQTCEADRSIIAPVVYATKEIKAGSIIRASDIAQKMVSYQILPSKSIPSALLIVGFKAANNLPARIMIMSQDVCFTAKLAPTEELEARHEISEGMKKWHSQADLRWFKSSLRDRTPSIQEEYKN